MLPWTNFAYALSQFPTHSILLIFLLLTLLQIIPFTQLTLTPYIHNDDTVVAGFTIYPINNVDATVFYDNKPCAQMDGGASVSDTNLLNILHNVKFFFAKFKSKVCMHGATSKEVITAWDVGYIQVKAIVKEGFIDEYATTCLTLALLCCLKVVSSKQLDLLNNKSLSRYENVLCAQRRSLGQTIEV